MPYLVLCTQLQQLPQQMPLVLKHLVLCLEQPGLLQKQLY